MPNYTLTYSESSQGWPSFYSFYPEYMMGSGPARGAFSAALVGEEAHQVMGDVHHAAFLVEDHNDARTEGQIHGLGILH